MALWYYYWSDHINYARFRPFFGRIKRFYIIRRALYREMIANFKSWRQEERFLLFVVFVINFSSTSQWLSGEYHSMFNSRLQQQSAYNSGAKTIWTIRGFHFEGFYFSYTSYLEFNSATSYELTWNIYIYILLRTGTRERGNSTYKDLSFLWR